MFKRFALAVVLLGMLTLSVGCSSNSFLSSTVSDAQYTIDVMTIQAINASDAKATKDAAFNALFDNPDADYMSQNPHCKSGKAGCCRTLAQ